MKPNSFVRARMEFEFYEKEEIYTQGAIEDDDVHSVVMLGGYG